MAIADKGFHWSTPRRRLAKIAKTLSEQADCAYVRDSAETPAIAITMRVAESEGRAKEAAIFLGL